MERTAPNRLIGFLKRLTDAALIFEGGFLLLSLVFYLFTVFGNDELISAWPVHFAVPTEQVATEPAYKVVVTGGSITSAALLANEGELSFTSSGSGYYLLKLADILVPFAIAIWITYLARRLFQSLKAQSPFTAENPGLIRNIALLLILLLPYSLLRAWIYHSYIRERILMEGIEYGKLTTLFSETGPTLWLDWSPNLEALLAGLLLLVVAEIFRTGEVLKTDNEAII
ncbi:MAG: hypothetical protein WBB45_00770 [Cyclobacteriaceae bacterium]